MTARWMWPVYCWRIRRADTPLEGVDELGHGDLRLVVDEWVHVVTLAGELLRLRFDVLADSQHDLHDREAVEGPSERFGGHRPAAGEVHAVQCELGADGDRGDHQRRYRQHPPKPGLGDQQCRPGRGEHRAHREDGPSGEPINSSTSAPGSGRPTSTQPAAGRPIEVPGRSRTGPARRSETARVVRVVRAM
jgi:hypothetical protein